MAEEWRRDGYLITTAPDRVDLDIVHGYLSRSYWASGIARERVARSIAHSLPFSLYHADRQVGFARVVSDRTTFAYLADVFVLEEYRGRGLSKWLVETILSHPELQGLRRWVLVTRDAHGLYERFGFAPLATPGNYLEKRPPTNAVGGP